ncbi:hypothetical protein ABIB50_004469 [Mucilaginibacter sp. UYCu711]
MAKKRKLEQKPQIDFRMFELYVTIIQNRTDSNESE